VTATRDVPGFGCPRIIMPVQGQRGASFMIRLRRIPLAVSLAAAVAFGGHSALSTAAATRTISVKDDVFAPKKATVSKKTLVTWRWASDSGAHDVVSRGTKRFKSSEIKSRGVHRYRFKRTGTYRYICTLHEDVGMIGQIIVR
jgi:plastocyanin